MPLLTTAPTACPQGPDDATPCAGPPPPGAAPGGRTAASGIRRSTFDGLDLNLLRVFAALMRERNVTRAGAALCLSQSAVSNSLQRLRAALGDMLFERTASGIRPTSHGLELWQQLQPHYLQIEKVLTPEAFDPLTYEGAFTIAMSDYTAERIMPRLGAHLETHAPRVQLNLLPYSVANMFPMFEREGIDLAIGANRDDAQHARGLRASTLWPIHSRCLMRRDHPLAQGELTMARFLSARHLDVCLPGMTMPLYDNLLAAHGIRRNLILTLNHYTQTLAVLAATDYIGVLPVSLLDLSAYADRLCQRDPPIPMPERPLGLIWHQRHDSSSPQVWLRQVLIDLFAQPEGGAASSPPLPPRYASGSPT